MSESSGRSWLKPALALIVLFAAFLLVTAPARILPPLIHKLSPAVQLHHASGTLWQGEVASAVVALEGGALNLGKLSWRIKPLSLLWLKPAIHISTDAGSHYFNADLAVSLLSQQLELENITGAFPLALLEPWLPPLARGQIELDIDRIAFDDKRLLDASGKLYVQQLDWIALSRPMPLGSYIAELSVVDDGLQVALSDRGAQLGAEGLLLISPGGSYQVDVRLSPGDQLAPEIANALVYMGRKTDEGDVLVTSKGRWQ